MHLYSREPGDRGARRVERTVVVLDAPVALAAVVVASTFGVLGVLPCHWGTSPPILQLVESRVEKVDE